MSNQPEKQRPRLTLIPPTFLAALADVLYKGDQKHEPMGWMKQSIRQRLDSLGRHYLDLCAGVDFDPEFGHQHAVHLAANALMIWWQIEQGYSGSGLDQRRFRTPARAEDPRLEQDIAATLDAVVPSRSLLGSLRKLQEETGELATEVEWMCGPNGDDGVREVALGRLRGELADVFICLSDIARLAGVELVPSVEEKLAVLRSRDQAARAADRAAVKTFADDRFSKPAPDVEF